MKFDNYGQCYVNCEELVDLIYKNPEINIENFLVSDQTGIFRYRQANQDLYADLPELQEYKYKDYVSLEEFHQQMQSKWKMPDEYKNLDIAKWVLDQCTGPEELQRAGQELLLFQECQAFDLLRYLKYLVDTFRKHNIVWGVGRGSSVASYVLYLIGVHKINSLYFQLDIKEFIK